MSDARINLAPVQFPGRWLKTYYFMRTAVSVGWIVAAVAVGRNVPPVAAALLVAYPAWDGIANYIDAEKNGGLRSNPSQALNLVASAAAAIAVAIALGSGMSAVFRVFGAWAILSGIFQLVTGVRRWKSVGAQWAMVLSGLQSALAGDFFFKMANTAGPLNIVGIAPYAAFGAFYFLVSATWLTVKNARRPTAVAAS